jgi:hypothetical protein
MVVAADTQVRIPAYDEHSQGKIAYTASTQLSNGGTDAVIITGTGDAKYFYCIFIGYSPNGFKLAAHGRLPR